MRIAVWVAMMACALAPAVDAAPPVLAQTEINFLLESVATSGCEFYRNGTWYDAKRAEAHLRSKYDWLAARDLVDDAEEFIDRAGTKSSLSGREYLVRCTDHAVETSSQWLRDELARMRALPK